MHGKLLVTMIAGGALLLWTGGAEAQDLGSTTAAMGAAATIGTGIGSSARGAMDAAHGAGVRDRGLQIDEADGPGRPPGARGGGGAVRGGAARERGLYLDDDYDETPEFVGPAPEDYQVRKGDTLWDLCGRYLGDPWSWPRVWAMNPAITNPHWIFPGDHLRFGTGGGAAPPAPRARGPRLTVARTAPVASRALVLRTNGFVSSKELAGSSKIVGSREEKQLLSTLDQIYVEFPADHPLKVGERYTIYKPKTVLHHPVGGAVVGNIVEIVGEVKIEQITKGRIARGTIVEALDSIERGNRVGPLMRQLRQVARRPNRVQVEGRILGMIRLGTLIGQTELVFIDKGRKDSVSEGNLFYVVRRGDGYRPMMERVVEEDPRFPKEVVAEIVVVEARDETSVGWVTRSTKEIKAGDRLEMRKGY
jgi:hypothetical protein